jgi:aryl-alcohol dehydrogenase-like predicted oxidoreductase
MHARTLGRTGRTVSEIGFGAWQIGADWGAVDEDAALATLRAAADAGVTFFDTADVYGDGRSERLVGRLLAERPDAGLTVATKMGRRLAAQEVDGYTPANLRAWNDRSRANLGVDTLDLVQLHCPPTDLYYRPEVFAELDAMVAEGRMAAYGVSVERVEEALKAIEYPGVATVQIIFNAFRQRPARRFLGEAAARGVGVIVRVPLASGLLSGRRDPRAVRPPLGPHGRRGLDGHPRRPLRRAGPGERRRRGPRPAAGRDARGGRRRVRPPHRPVRRPALVAPPPVPCRT